MTAQVSEHLPMMAADATASEPARRDFLKLVAGAFAGIGAAAFAWTLIDSMEPSADVIAAGGAVDVDLSKLEAGQQIIVLWRGTPIFIINRPASALKMLQDASLAARLSDPNSDVPQQPIYARNWHRSIKPEFAVLVGICTHLGCVPGYWPKPDPSNPAPNWPGGYLCPCHGSKYDLAGRVYRGVPAPYNLPVPPYHFPNDHTARVGENPKGQTFDIASLVQM